MLTRFRDPFDFDLDFFGGRRRNRWPTLTMTQLLKDMEPTFVDNFPNINISETDQQITIEAELAGFSKDDAKIELTSDNRLVISGKKKRRKRGAR